ncbi:hypothetical protein F4604DRAFT_1741109 [Suillus subluteus]|nr:hypothetical protein F4604DRAFT_1741109 [Suillus subluteus]
MSNESAPFVKNLIFQSKDLGKQSDLMLVFDGKVDGMGDHSPVMKATYRSQLAFTKPQVEHGSVIGAATAVEINAPVEGTSSYLKATNLAGAKQDLAIGFMGHGALLPTPMLYFKNVGDDDFVTAHFKPMLRAYVTSDYQETEIWKNSPKNSTFLWEEDLADLDETTTWNLTWNGHTGRYTIAQA